MMYFLILLHLFIFSFWVSAGGEKDNLPEDDIQPESDTFIWEQTGGPTGGIINQIEIHPTNPNILYAAGAGEGIFKTTNSGESWELVSSKTTNLNCIRLIISPKNPKTIYALFRAINQLGKSLDEGETWTALLPEKQVKQFNMYYKNPSILIAGTWDRELFISDNSGKSWKNISFDFPENHGFNDLAISGKKIYWVGARDDENRSDAYLYRTTDGGSTWSKVELNQQENTYVRSIFVDPEDNNTIYIGMANRHNESFDMLHDRYFFKTKNGGRDWDIIRIPQVWSSVIDIMGRAPYDDYLYIGLGQLVARSNNEGKTWEYVAHDENLPMKPGDMYDIAIDPRDKNILYLPLRGHGIVKSVDNGRTWKFINDGIKNVQICLLEIPPNDTSNPGVIFSATYSGEGTFRSLDYGDTWENVTLNGIEHPWADEIVFDPHDEDTIWEVADDGQFFVTEDLGNTWKRIFSPRRGYKGFRAGSVYAFAVAPSDPDIIYSLKNGFGIYKSIDRGETWRFLHQSEVDYTYSITVHPNDPGTVYSGYNPKSFQDWAMVRKTTNGGDSWQTVLEVPQSGGINSVAIDPGNPDTVYAGSIGKQGGRIYKTSNGGAAWNILNEHFTMCTVWGQPQLVVSPDNPDTAYAATWLAGTWKTEDAGKTWVMLKEAPFSSTALSIDENNKNILYSSDRTAPKVWKTADAGKTWTLAADFTEDRAFMVNRVLVFENTVYASTFGPDLHGGKLYKSANSGLGWSDITGNLPRSVLDIAVNPENSEIIYVTTHIFGAYKSTNGGKSWEELANFPNIGAYDIEIDSANPSILYTCGLSGSVPDWCMKPKGYTFSDDAGVYKSTDSGSTWKKILSTSNECRAVRIHPDNHNVIFASAMDDGLKISTDAGASWTSYNSGLDTTVLTSCAVNGNRIYTGTQGCGVYSGDINIRNWSVAWQSDRSNKPVPEVYSMQIEVDPKNSNRIFVGSNPGGLYRSDNGGKTFYDRNFLTPTVIVDDPLRQGYYTYAINPSDTSEVWVGTWGKGIYKSFDHMDFNIAAYGSRMEMYGTHINRIVIDPESPNTVYVATEEGMFQSSDKGETWKDFNNGLDTLQIRTLEMTSDGTLICGTLGYELYSSNDKTSKWEQLNALDNAGTFWPIWDNRPLYQYSTLLFHPEKPERVYFGTFPAGIYISNDGGKSFRESNTGWTNDGVFCLVVRPDDTDVIYSGTYNGLNVSLDGGASWEKWDTGWPDEQWVFSIDFDPGDPLIMYACSKNGENEGQGKEGFHGTVMKSLDGGRNWFPVTDGLETNQEFYKIIVDKFNPDILYLATEHDGIYISYNNGESWEGWNEGLTNLKSGTNGNNVTNVMKISPDEKYLYFGTMGSGIFRRRIK